MRDVLGGVLRNTPLSPMSSVYVAFGLSAAVVAILFLYWEWRTGVRRPTPPRHAGAGRATLLGLAVVCAVGFLWFNVLRQSAELATASHLALRLPTSLEAVDLDACLRIAALLVVAPLFEEWLFRGLLFRTLRQSWSVAGSVALSAVLFTVIHPAASSVGVLSLAVVTALVYERTGRLAAPMAIHFGYNLMVMALWTL